MIKNILVRNIKMYYIFITPLYSTVYLEFPKEKGPLSSTAMKALFDQYQYESIVIKYNYNPALFDIVKQLAIGDTKAFKLLAHWIFIQTKKLISFPPFLSYLVILYAIYKTYKMIESCQSILTKYSHDNNNEVLNGDIKAMLYRNVVFYNKIYEKELYTTLKNYKHIMGFLEFMGIRKIFWYNKEYETYIDTIFPLLERRFAIA